MMMHLYWQAGCLHARLQTALCERAIAVKAEGRNFAQDDQWNRLVKARNNAQRRELRRNSSSDAQRYRERNGIPTPKWMTR